MLKKAAERFNVPPEKITLKQGELSSYAEVNDFFEAFADNIEIMALLEISSFLRIKQTTCLPADVTAFAVRTRGTYHVHGKSRNPGWKIK